MTGMTDEFSCYDFSPIEQPHNSTRNCLKLSLILSFWISIFIFQSVRSLYALTDHRQTHQ